MKTKKHSKNNFYKNCEKLKLKNGILDVKELKENKKKIFRPRKKMKIYKNLCNLCLIFLTMNKKKIVK